jgi:hypothetical protein
VSGNLDIPVAVMVLIECWRLMATKSVPWEYTGTVVHMIDSDELTAFYATTDITYLLVSAQYSDMSRR